MSELFKRQADILVLSVLAVGPRHGYDVIETIRARSGGNFELAEGTVYPLLHRLEGEGLIASDWTSEDGRRRRMYRMTDQGLQALNVRRADWQRFSNSLNAVIEGVR